MWFPVLRSIPAWAGKPGDDGRVAHRPEVHPRVGGETASPFRREATGRGPSPRGRGNPALAGGTLTLTGSIPAWAGKPNRQALPT